MTARGGLIEDSPQRHRDHGGGCFSPGRETRPPRLSESDGGQATAREKSLRLRRKPFSLTPTVAMKPSVYETVPAGLRSFARSPSPDRAKNIVPSVLSGSLWFVKAYIERWYLKYPELNA